jgi:hypothetical protein
MSDTREWCVGLVPHAYMLDPRSIKFFYSYDFNVLCVLIVLLLNDVLAYLINGKWTFIPCNVGMFCFIPYNFFFFRMLPCNVDNFVLPHLLTFLLIWQEKSHVNIVFSVSEFLNFFMSLCLLVCFYFCYWITIFFFKLQHIFIISISNQTQGVFDGVELQSFKKGGKNKERGIHDAKKRYNVQL